MSGPLRGRGARVSRRWWEQDGLVTIYCATMFYFLVMYFPIPSKPDSTIASSNDGYYQLPPPCLLVCLPLSCRATLCWKLIRDCSILGVSNYVSATNNNTAYVTALKKCSDTFGSAPSRIKIRDNCPQLFLAL